MAIPSFASWSQNSSSTTPSQPTGGILPTPSTPSGIPSLKQWSGGTVSAPATSISKKNIVESVGESGQGIAESFVTGLGGMTGRILDQILHLGSQAIIKPIEGKIDTGLAITEKGLESLGFNTQKIKKAKDFDIVGRIEKYRTKLKSSIEGGVDVAHELNPMSKTFAGQTAEILGGVVPQVALAFAKAPQLALALSESVMNTEDSYDENIKKGMDKKEALKRVFPQLGADLLGTYLTNKLGAFSKFSGSTKTIFKSRIVEALKDSSLEIGQEVWQQGLQNLATDKPFTKGMSETAKLTIIPALLFGAVGNIRPNTTIEEQQELKNKISESITTINTKLESGQKLTNDEKIVLELTNGIDPFIEEQGLPEVAPLPEAPVSAPTATPEGIPTAPTTAEALANAEAKIPKTDPLIEEAKKYKSAEEFIISKTKPEIDNIYDNIYNKYKQELPSLADEKVRGMTEMFLKRMGGDNVALASFLHDGNKISRRIFSELTGLKWGKDINQTKIKEGTGSLLNTILEKRGIDKSQLTDIWKKANEAPTTQPVEAATQTGLKTAPSPYAKSLEQSAIDRGITKGFAEIAGYTPSTLKEQSDLTNQVIRSGPENIASILRGTKPLPLGLKGGPFTVGIETWLKTNPNEEIAYALANSPLTSGVSEGASELGLMQERNPDSAGAKVNKIKKTRETKTGKVKTEKIKKGIQKIADATREVNLSKEDLSWDNFLDSITC